MGSDILAPPLPLLESGDFAIIQSKKEEVSYKKKNGEIEQVIGAKPSPLTKKYTHLSSFLF